MNVRRLNKLSRQLREIALKASQDGTEFPLSTGELAIVENVARNPDITITELVQRTGLAQSWVSKVVRGFSDQGIFQCSQNPKDRRQTRVRLDPKAHRDAFENHGSRPIDNALEAAAPHLSSESLARAKVLLNELADLLDADPSS